MHLVRHLAPPPHRILLTRNYSVAAAYTPLPRLRSQQRTLVRAPTKSFVAHQLRPQPHYQVRTMVGITSFATGKVKKRIEAQAKQYEPEDPYYIYHPEHPDSTAKKPKRSLRPPPPGLTKQQAKLLRSVAKRAHYLDKGFTICGFRFGWTFFLGLIPFAGDLANVLLNYNLVAKPAKRGAERTDHPLPDWLWRQMLLNNAVSAGVGFVPLVGDIGMAVWKANSRNAKLFEEFLRVVGEEQIKQGVPNLTVAEGAAHPAQAAARELVNDGSSSTGVQRRR